MVGGGAVGPRAGVGRGAKGGCPAAANAEAVEAHGEHAETVAFRGRSWARFKGVREASIFGGCRL